MNPRGEQLLKEMAAPLAMPNIAPETDLLIRLAIRAQQGEPLEKLVAELPQPSTTPALQSPCP